MGAVSPPLCPRCGSRETQEIHLALVSASARWFDCRNCKHVFRVIPARPADEEEDASREA
jgi:hypothetical protein